MILLVFFILLPNFVSRKPSRARHGVWPARLNQLNPSGAIHVSRYRIGTAALEVRQSLGRQGIACAGLYKRGRRQALWRVDGGRGIPAHGPWPMVPLFH